MNSQSRTPARFLAPAVALLISFGVLALSAAGFARVDGQLGLWAGSARQGIITVDVLSH